MTERESIGLWSTTAASNATDDPNIGWAEGQLPSTVNNSARGLMAAIARDKKDNDGSLTTAGSANAYTLTIHNTWTAYANGQKLSFKASFANTGPATLNVTNADSTALGAKALRGPGDTALSGGMITSGGRYFVQYDTTANSASGGWVLVGAGSILIGTANGGIQINGGFDIDQYQSGATKVITATGSIVHDKLIDGWMFGNQGTYVVTFQQVTDAPPGLTHSLKMTVGTAQTSIGSSDVATLLHPIEGTRCAMLNWGTANNQYLSVAFWIKAHRTGTYSGSVKNSANTAGYAFNIVVSAADTWEYKTIIIPGTSSGVWETGTGVGVFLHITIMAGSTFTGTDGVWGGATDNVTGTINGLAATSDIFQITGVVVIPGAVAPTSDRLPAIMRSADEELKLCRRYYRQTSGSVNGEPSLYGYNNAGQLSGTTILHPVPMRITPTITTSGTWTVANCAQPTFVSADPSSYLVYTTVTGLNAFTMQPAGSAITKFDARYSI